MGMFDSLYVECRKCHEEIEFQSKAGDCSLHSYKLDNCPPGVAGDIIGQSQSCQCGNVVTIRGAVMLFAEQG